MSTLTIALASLGGVVLAGVVAHGAWQARKAGPKRATPAPERSEPREPVMDPMDAASAVAAAAEAPADLPERRANRRIVNRLDALIDAIAAVRIEAPVSGAFVIAHLPTSRRAGGKPFLIEGLNSETGEWGGARPRPALLRVPGRRSAREPDRRAERDRVLRVRAEGPGFH